MVRFREKTQKQPVSHGLSAQLLRTGYSSRVMLAGIINLLWIAEGAP